MIGSNNILTYGWLVSCIVSLFITIKLFQAYFKTKEKIFQFFGSFIGFRFLLFFSLLLAYPLYLMLDNLTIAGILLSLFWVFVFVSLIFPPLIFCHFVWKKGRNIYSGILALVALIAIIIIIGDFPLVGAAPDKSVVFLQSRVEKWLYPITKTVSLMPLAILFLYYAFKEQGKKRLRSLLMGLGLLFIVTTIFVPAKLPSLWPGIYVILGDILIFAGVMTKPEA